MLSPEYLRRITEGSEQIAEELHQYIISEIVSRMMMRIGRGEDYILTSADAWRIKTLQESGELLEDILIGSSYGELVNPLVQFQAARDSNRVAGRNKKSDSDRYLVEVVDENGSYQIEAEEHEQWT